MQAAVLAVAVVVDALLLLLPLLLPVIIIALVVVVAAVPLAVDVAVAICLPRTSNSIVEYTGRNSATLYTQGNAPATAARVSRMITVR